MKSKHEISIDNQFKFKSAIQMQIAQ